MSECNISVQQSEEQAKEEQTEVENGFVANWNVAMSEIYWQ